MRRGLNCLVLLLSLLLPSSAQVRLQSPPPPTAKLIKAGRVLDVKSGKYLLDQGILTEGERIKDLGAWAEVKGRAPADAVVIDLSQATLLPGLISKDRLQRAMKIGVKIEMGSDAWALISGKTRGEETLFELKQLEAEGMPALDMINSSTTNAAELMGWSDRAGELAAGKFADIIAVQGDPLQDIALLQHVQFVMKGSTVVKNEFAKN